jgi:hypothetical protein
MNDTLQILDTRYAGDQQAFWWPAATVTMTTIAKNAMLVIDGIFKQTTITTLDTDLPMQPRQAEPTSDGNPITVNGRLIVPQDIMIYKEVNPRDFEAHWNAIDLSKVILARALPATAASYIVSQVLRRSFQYLDQCIWTGSVAYQGAVPANDPRYQLQFFDGMIKLLLADVNVVAIPSFATVTSSNVITFMNAAINATSAILLSNPAKYSRLKFVMNPATKVLFDIAISTGTTYKGTNYIQNAQDVWVGYEIIVLYGVPANTIVFGEFIDDGTGNFALGMNAYEDMQLEIMKKQNNAETWFVKGLMKMAVNYGWGNQVVLGTTLTTASFNP